MKFYNLSLGSSLEIPTPVANYSIHIGIILTLHSILLVFAHNLYNTGSRLLDKYHLIINNIISSILTYIFFPILQP